jgi:drug/metabolite transporter (DMT)-like permease
MKNATLYMITILIWGSTWFAIKFQLGHIDPMISIAYRFFLASVILFIYCFLSRRKLKFSVREHFLIFLQGIFSFSIGYWLVYVAEIQLTSGLVAVVCSSLIFLNIFNGSIFLKTKINMMVLVGATLGLSGIVLIFWTEIESFSFSDKNFVALLFAIAATLIYSFGNIIVEYNIKKKIPVIQGNAYSMAYSAIFMALLALISGKTFDFELSTNYLSSLLYLALFGSVIAFYCYFTLIGSIGADKAAYGPVVVPVIALFISSLFENYVWSKFAWIGIVLLLTGNLLVINKKTIAHSRRT